MPDTPAVPDPAVAIEAAEAASLRDRLRRDTRIEHEALDACFEGMFAEPDLRRYRVFTAMNLAAHRAVEPILTAVPPGPRWSPGRRLAALEEDARALALPEHEPAAFPIPRPDRAEAFGIAYVLEGSRLGAKFMMRALGDPGVRDDGDPVPARYLGASSDIGPFRDLLAAMAEAGLTEDERLRAIAAASATFRFFRETAERVDATGRTRR